MKKYPFTRKGLAALQDKLHAQRQSELMKQAVSIAIDPLSWIAENFELQVTQLEKLRTLPEDFRTSVGWCLAAAVFSRTPILVYSMEALSLATVQITMHLQTDLVGMPQSNTDKDKSAVIISGAKI